MSATGAGVDAVRATEPEVIVRQAITGYDDVAKLHQVDLRLGPGIHLLVGPNGSGKTTLFRAIAGVLPLWSGEVEVRQGRSRASIGYVGHRPALSPQLTVTQDLEFWSRVIGVPERSRDAAVRRVLDRLDLHGLADTLTRSLSRGQTQRVAIAKALVGDPAVLLLDEPLTGVDAVTADRVRSDLTRLADDGRVVIISSHELAELSGLRADVVAIRDGRIVVHESLAEITGEHALHRSWLRVRASPQAADWVQAEGYRLRHVERHSFEVYAEGPDDIAKLVAGLVGAGHSVYLVAPVRDGLTELLLSFSDHELEANGAHLD
ncbi:ABC transporter ATP-binding protein [Flexivirga meconopsidis]|uniref:ABC transporter ATP-binding protein n=1 Tax=Flexivirga meconopsidis TaxID=2977121 RepID=UPI002240B3C4|nr:ABC transporter ATP-binding protein [Flexivirga meconopsidis]